MANIFDPQYWAQVPSHFWTVMFFVLGSMVGSLLNVCIHRMPLGQSIIHPRSHCPHCKYSIPWYLNVPIFTWLYLRGKCKNCGATIAPRYLLIEILTGVAFATAWVRFGQAAPLLALAISILLAGFIVATFIDLEHFIIPDEITLGGIVAGFLFSVAVPALQHAATIQESIKASLWGIAIGGGLIYLILRGGKLMFGKEQVLLEENTRIEFTETTIVMPGHEVPFEELFYRKSDTINFHATQLELPDRCYWNVDVQLSPETLKIGADTYKPEEIPHMTAVTSRLVLPREAMGFGDVKFMAAIGAFLGWQAVIFALMASAVLGSIVGVTSILLRKNEWSSRIPYGPYIAIAATIYLFLPDSIVGQWREYVGVFPQMFRALYPG